ncbi:SGNH/GDSL hydrolase family protein [Rhodoferax koreensis]|uniref:SGNH/GDSL hydrolase family protein n=1 Tax=Rhodoferax koreensis TaxID=1842727 RepID=UPI001EF6620E|nr:SGNH/GDSL hydrolase family protein [Rhodoferax koreense]
MHRRRLISRPVTVHTEAGEIATVPPFARRRTLAFARPWLVGCAMVAAGWMSLPTAKAQTTAHNALRWQTSLSDFASADRAHPPGRDGVLFVGSSTIRMWRSMSEDFRQVPVVINRGFGGSTLADCDHYVRELVIQYQPRQVMVYAGDNDLAEGRTPQQVLESFQHFVSAVRSELPSAQITYISIKPSPARVALKERINETNALIGGYVKTLSNAKYIDIHTPMLTASGETRPELFQADLLHLNETGYALWKSLITPYLVTNAATAADASAAPPPAQVAAAR